MDLFMDQEITKPKKVRLAPITLNKRSNLAFFPPQDDATPNFKPLNKHSSYSDLIRQFESPLIKNFQLNLPTSNTKKLLPSLKPHLHSCKKSKVIQSTSAFKQPARSVFSSIKSKDLGITFSNNSIISSRDSQNSNIFLVKNHN